MQTLEYRTMDKSEWGEGPWQQEPDKKQWIDKETGLPCLIVRNFAGALCGYVGVPRGHVAYGRDYDSVDVDVHGGLTFADRCAPDAEEGSGICHLVEEGEDDDVWWLGFDCHHHRDLGPGMVAETKKMYERLGQAMPGLYDRHDVYRDLAYVESEVASLAQQLASMITVRNAAAAAG